MSISDEISKIRTAKSNISQAIKSKGVNVPDTAKLSDLAPLVEQIPQEVSGTDIIIDDYPKENSPNAISSGGVYFYLNLFSDEIKKLQDRVAALEAKIGDLSFAKSDTTPGADTDENVVTFVK